MAISADTVIKVAPELSSEETSRINYFITEAGRYINSVTWGAKADFAHALYTAHLMTISGLSGSAGVTSERVGDLSRSYAVNASDDSLASTSYGKQFMSLRKSLVITPIVVS